MDRVLVKEMVGKSESLVEDGPGGARVWPVVVVVVGVGDPQVQ